MDAMRRSLSSDSHQDEKQPLMRPMSSTNVGFLCFITMLSGLAILWCVVDQWNRSVSDALFGLGDVQVASFNSTYASEGFMVLRTSKPFPSFNSPLFLAFMQFAFMGLVFLMLFCTIFRDASLDWKDVNFSIAYDRRWPMLVVTHIFSMFWLQALMMPTQALSLGLFAATRAMEIPAAAVLRAPLVGVQLGRNTAQTAALACGGVALLYWAYAEVAGCLCVWSGHGVTLLGPAFWIVYLLLLLVPATNTVLQEGILQQPSMHPLLMLTLMNLFSCVLFVPVLIFAHTAGWEDVSGAIAMTFRFPQVSMLIAWLALQMTLISLVTVGVILLADSFWAVALRALRVVYWWIQQLWWFYAGAAVAGQSMSMSTACPHSSKWAFVMLCGFALAVTAIYTDRKAEDATYIKASGSCEPATKSKKGAEP